MIRPALLLVSCLLSTLSTVSAAERKPLAWGASAPEFALPGIDGNTHRLKDYTRDVLAVVFTCNHCPTAQAYEERIKRLVNDYRDRGVDLVAISPNADKAVRLDEQGYSIVGDSLEDMKTHAAVHGFNFPYLYDGETQATSEAFGVIATPHIYIFDKERRLRYQGRIDDSEDGKNIQHQEARDALNSLLKGEEVAVKETRVFGCTTKWLEKGAGTAKSDEAWAALEVSLDRIDAAGIKALAGNKTDKLRLINVWATWCAPCVIEIPELVKLNRIYHRRGFELITVSVDDPGKEETVLKFLKSEQVAMGKPTEQSLGKEGRKSNNYLFTGRDKDALAEALDPDWHGGYPHTVLVAPGGKVLFRHTGEVEMLQLRRAIVGFLGRTYAGRSWAP